jgi:hypothetical protein
MFDANKILQWVCYLLLLNNGRMNLLKITKEMYLADRESIKEREYSISGDTYFSMSNGPVLSNTLNMLTDKTEWNDFFEWIPTGDYDDIALKKDASQLKFDMMSEKDKKYIKKISDKYKDVNKWAMVDITHGLPEWTNVPKGTRKKIGFSDVLKALEFSDNEISEIKQEQDFIKKLDSLSC